MDQMPQFIQLTFHKTAVQFRPIMLVLFKKKKKLSAVFTPGAKRWISGRNLTVFYSSVRVTQNLTIPIVSPEKAYSLAGLQSPPGYRQLRLTAETGGGEKKGRERTEEKSWKAVSGCLSVCCMITLIVWLHVAGNQEGKFGIFVRHIKGGTLASVWQVPFWNYRLIQVQLLTDHPIHVSLCKTLTACYDCSPSGDGSHSLLTDCSPSACACIFTDTHRSPYIFSPHFKSRKCSNSFLEWQWKLCKISESIATECKFHYSWRIMD